jgi:MFS family permease
LELILVIAVARARTLSMVLTLGVSLLSFGLGFANFIAMVTSLGTIYSFGDWLPALKERVHASDAEVAAIVGLLQAAFYLGSVPACGLIRVLGFRGAYLAGGSLVALCFLGVAYATQLWMLYVLLFLAGLGMACSKVSSSTLIPQHLEGANSTTCISLACTGSGVGLLSGRA